MWGQRNDTAPNDPEDWRYCRDCLRRDRDTGRCPVKGTHVAPWDNACGRRVDKDEEDK